MRCVAIYNNSPNNEVFQDLQVYVDQNTASPFTDIDIALGTAALGDEEQTVASEDVMPRDVYFTFAKGGENALVIGDLPKGSWKALWIRRHAGPAKSGSSYRGDNYILGFKVRTTESTPTEPPVEPPPGGGGGGGGGGIPPGWYWPNASPACNNSAYKSPNYINIDLVDGLYHVRVYQYPDLKTHDYSPFPNITNAEAYKTYLQTCQVPNIGGGASVNDKFGIRMIYATRPRGGGAGGGGGGGGGGAIPAGWYWPSPSPACNNSAYKSPNFINIDVLAGAYYLRVYQYPDFKTHDYGPFPNITNAEGYKTYLQTCQIPNIAGGGGTGADVSEPWFMDMAAASPHNANDCRFSSSITVTKNSDGSFRSTSIEELRLHVYISNISGCNRDAIERDVRDLDTYDHSEWASRGYIYKPHDWKNIEITGYYKIVKLKSGLNPGLVDFWVYTRGVSHSSAIADGCGGSAYRFTWSDKGDDIGYQKEMYHNIDLSNNCGDRLNIGTRVDSGSGNLIGKWFGIKCIMWNTSNNTNVHLETWMDKDNTNAWVKVKEENDTGGIYPGAPSTTCPGGEACGGTRDERFTWGSPLLRFNWRDVAEMHFKNFSVREIVPPS